MVGVVCALRSEARHLGRTLSRDAEVETLAGERLLTVTGMGGRAAAAGAEALVGAGAAALLSFGLAGGLDPRLPAGQIFLADEITAPDGSLLVSDAAWREDLRASLLGHAAVACGRLVSSVAVVASVAAKAELYRATGAGAVDMESAAIAGVARRRAVPFLAVRVIIDRAGDALPGAVVAATDEAGRLAAWPLLGQLLSHPGQVAALARLAHGYRAASRSLATVARRGALEPRPRVTASGSPGGAP